MTSRKQITIKTTVDFEIFPELFEYLNSTVGTKNKSKRLLVLAYTGFLIGQEIIQAKSSVLEKTPFKKDEHENNNDFKSTFSREQINNLIR